MGSHDSKFGNLKKILNHSMNVERDEYPKTLQSAYELLVNTLSNQRFEGRRTTAGRRGRLRVNFAQRGVAIPGNNGILHQDIRCYSCNRNVHYSDLCPNRNNNNGNQGVDAAKKGENNEEQGEEPDGNQQGANTLNNNWILLDSCSSDSCTNDLKKVANLNECEGNEILELHTNCGILEFNKKGEMKMLPVEMYYTIPN